MFHGLHFPPYKRINFTMTEAMPSLVERTFTVCQMQQWMSWVWFAYLEIFFQAGWLLVLFSITVDRTSSEHPWENEMGRCGVWGSVPGLEVLVNIWGLSMSVLFICGESWCMTACPTKQDQKAGSVQWGLWFWQKYMGLWLKNRACRCCGTTNG